MTAAKPNRGRTPMARKEWEEARWWMQRARFYRGTPFFGEYMAAQHSAQRACRAARAADRSPR